ncbi:hypothetical protein BHE74_00040465 [Ensete ventricosum]|nr:hypothetical protein BHE74_00040465 [Ensete ventricosum]
MPASMSLVWQPSRSTSPALAVAIAGVGNTIGLSCLPSAHCSLAAVAIAATTRSPLLFGADPPLHLRPKPPSPLSPLLPLLRRQLSPHRCPATYVVSVAPPAAPMADPLPLLHLKQVQQPVQSQWLQQPSLPTSIFLPPPVHHRRLLCQILLQNRWHHCFAGGRRYLLCRCCNLLCRELPHLSSASSVVKNVEGTSSSPEPAIAELDKNQHQIDADLLGIVRSSSLSAVPSTTCSACFSLSLSDDSIFPSFVRCCQHHLFSLTAGCNRNRASSASSIVVVGPPLPNIEVPSFSLSSDSFCSIHSAAPASCQISSSYYVSIIFLSQAYIVVEVNCRRIFNVVDNIAISFF